MSVVEVHNLSIRYITGDIKSMGLKDYLIRKARHQYTRKEIWANRHIGFSLCKGDMLGIIGANGAGKSTLLKAISGIISPTEGSVETKGILTGIMELTTGFDGDLTVKENIYLRGAISGCSKQFIRTYFGDILDFAELQDFENIPFRQLSSGMKSRLAFAISSLIQPDILLLDEILAVGDGAFRKKSESKIRSMISAGATTILISHSISQIKSLCNKVLWLHKGIQMGFGTDVEGICNQYVESLESRKNV